MQSAIQIAFFAVPVLFALGAALLIVGYAGFTLSTPSALIYPFLILLFFVSDISYGRLDAVAPSIFTRGVGYLLFPMYLWLVLLSLIWSRAPAVFSLKPTTPLPPLDINRWFFSWLVLFVAHVCVAVVVGADLQAAVGPNGFSNIVWMWIFFLVVVASVRTEDSVLWLTRIVMVAGLGRAIFGLVRWAAFGGDPSNAYANRHGLNLKLTFFDIYDSLLCLLTICIAAMWLFRGERAGKRSFAETLFLWSCMAIPALCIVLSFRRTAAIGLLIAGVFLLAQLPARARWQLVLVAAPGLFIGAGYALWKRLSQTSASGGLDRLFFDIMPSAIGPESVRLLELKLAWATFLDHPLFGVGSWGSYVASGLISWQGDSGGGFLHSAVLHLALKTGVLGLFLLAGVAVSFALFWRRVRKHLTSVVTPLAVAGVAGVLFAMPDFLIGTPLTKVRAMQMLGFCMALPYVAALVSGAVSSVSVRSFAAGHPTVADALGRRHAAGSQ
jgi:hypothetical protein